MRRKLTAPLGVELKITNGCNLKCVHCLAESGNISPDEISFQETCEFVDQTSDMKVFSFGITGGEPLTRPDFLEIIAYAKRKKLKVHLTTNGTLMDKQIASCLKKLKVDLVRISLDGYDSHTHEGFRKVNGCFNKTINGIRNILNEKIPVTVLTVVSKYNFNFLKEIVSTVRKQGVKAINLYHFAPAGRGAAVKEYAFSQEEYFIFLKKLVSQKKRTENIQVISDTPLMNIISGKKGSGTCPAGTFYLFVKETGEVLPCPYFFHSLGNIRNLPLRTIWEKSQLLTDLLSEDSLAKVCRKCEYMAGCFGGCRAAAFHAYGSISQPDPFCWLTNEIKK